MGELLGELIPFSHGLVVDEISDDVNLDPDMLAIIRLGKRWELVVHGTRPSSNLKRLGH